MNKSVNIIFLLRLKFYQNFKNHHAGKLNKTHLVNICFAQTSRTVSWNRSFYFCLNVHKLDDSFTFIWKKFLCHIFLFQCHIFIAQKMKFSIKDFFSKCVQIRSFLRIWSHLLKKSLMENFIFCVVFVVWILWIELQIYSQKVWFFDKFENKFENTIHGLSW